MPSRKQSKSRHKLSFAVDRSEIDISSDWVQAVMEPPSLPSPAVSPPQGPPFSARETKNATVETVATVEATATVEHSAPVVNKATVADNATDALFEEIHAATVEIIATVARDATVATISTVAASAGHRALRLRPIHRITDGLTPGQYSVYRLMFENGECRAPGANRLFRGGYVDLVRLTGLSKRGIQNVIAELQAKFVISLHQAPGYHRSETSVYEVPPEQQVLDGWFAQGLRYAAGKSKNLMNITTVA